MRKEFINHHPSSRYRTCQKFYLQASKFGKAQVGLNNAIEGNYHRAMEQIKKLYAQLPSEADRTIFEMNRKYDRTSVDGMHDFVTNSLHWSLECDIWGKCWVYYAFHNCPFEKQIKTLIAKNYLSEYVKAKHIPDFKQYYKEVLACQPKEFISVLKAEQL